VKDTHSVYSAYVVRCNFTMSATYAFLRILRILCILRILRVLRILRIFCTLRILCAENLALREYALRICVYCAWKVRTRVFAYFARAKNAGLCRFCVYLHGGITMPEKMHFCVFVVYYAWQIYNACKIRVSAHFAHAGK
jgi:hypothetical protein